MSVCCVLLAQCRGVGAVSETVKEDCRYPSVTVTGVRLSLSRCPYFTVTVTGVDVSLSL